MDRFAASLSVMLNAAPGRAGARPDRPRLAVIVHTDRGALRVLRRRLEAAGYDVHTVREFQEARRAIELHRPALLCTAVQLGAFNGLHLVMLHRQLCPHGRSVALTAYPDPVLQKDAETLGAEWAELPPAKARHT